MGTKETAQAFINAWQSGDPAEVAAVCADNFTFSGAVPQALDVQAAGGLVAIMKNAFPDIQYHTRITHIEGDVVHVVNQVTGTHTGDLDLTPMGLGVIPATRRTFSLPEELGRITIAGDKVVNFHVDAPSNGGLPGILAQIGVTMP